MSILVNPANATLDPSPSGGARVRYQVQRELGKGGMGVVQLCRDARIGRDVAMKVIRPDLQAKQDACTRFLREARIQGQLEHPGIVPVYNMDADENGAMYFTMKSLRGLTLSQIIKGLKQGDASISASFSRRKLLTAFSSLCLTVDFAHSRGVLHRDIKPANIMLGDFGEVYLLDWGIAKILDSPVTTIDMRGTFGGQSTVPGELLGTPGYIAPEQAWGSNDRLDARTDVYSLGAILFEMLTLTPLHVRGDVLKILRSTTEGVDARASVRAPEREIPPELDEICVKATAREQSKRTPSARALHDAIERFLDGDRNLELRRDLASEHASRAKGAVEAALREAGIAAEDSRRKALREVGSALVLDPDNEPALSALREVLTAPPTEVPAEVTAELHDIESKRLQFQIREAIRAEILGVAITLAAVLWMGLRDIWSYVALAALTLVSTAFKLAVSRKPEGVSARRNVYFAFLFQAGATLTMSRAWGPVFVMPVMLVMFAYGYSSIPWRGHRFRVLITAIGIQVAAVLLEYTGFWPRSYEFTGGAMTILPRAVTLSELPTMVSLTMFALFMLVMPLRIVGGIEDALRDTELRALVQQWQLRQLVPMARMAKPS